MLLLRVVIITVIIEFQDDIARMIETVGDVEWRLPTSRRWAARRLVRMWERGGAVAFGNLPLATAEWTIPARRR